MVISVGYQCDVRNAETEQVARRDVSVAPAAAAASLSLSRLARHSPRALSPLALSPLALARATGRLPKQQQPNHETNTIPPPLPTIHINTYNILYIYIYTYIYYATNVTCEDMMSRYSSVTLSRPSSATPNSVASSVLSSLISTTQFRDFVTAFESHPNSKLAGGSVVRCVDASIDRDRARRREAAEGRAEQKGAVCHARVVCVAATADNDDDRRRQRRRRRRATPPPAPPSVRARARAPKAVMKAVKFDRPGGDVRVVSP